jgi:hypothetical protein
MATRLTRNTVAEEQREALRLEGRTIELQP